MDNNREDQILTIKVPINKTYFTTFLNSFLPIHFFNSTEFTLESLKNLLFPPQHPDKEFNDLVSFIKIVLDEVIRNSKDGEAIGRDLRMKVSLKEIYNHIINLII